MKQSPAMYKDDFLGEYCMLCGNGTFVEVTPVELDLVICTACTTELPRFARHVDILQAQRRRDELNEPEYERGA